jgi:hypothetical protein
MCIPITIYNIYICVFQIVVSVDESKPSGSGSESDYYRHQHNTCTLYVCISVYITTVCKYVPIIQICIPGTQMTSVLDSYSKR